MQAPSVPYEQYLLNDGPWTAYGSSVVSFWRGTPSWCNDVPYCLSSWAQPVAVLSSYFTSYYITIEVDRNRYPNSNSLQCTLSYKAMWFSPQITEGTLAPIQALVGEELFRNSLPAGDYAQGGLNGIWQGRTYTHDTEVPLSQNQGTSTAEIPLVINLTMPLNNFYVFLKSLSFKIDTQSAGNPITTSISSTSSTSSVYSTSSTSSISRSFSASHFSSTSVLSSSGPTIASQPKKDHTAQIVAAVMGVLALCAFIALGFFFFRMKQRKHKRPEVTTDNVPITPLNHPTNTETPPIRDIKPMAPIRATHESRHPAFVRSL